jgi:putative ABC transport system substrate-binding protein
LYISDIPAVFTVVADPEGAELVAKGNSLSGRNVTGVSHIVPFDLQLKAFRSVIPVMSIGTAYNPKEKNSQLQIDRIRELATKDGYALYEKKLEISDNQTESPARLKNAIMELIACKPDIFYLPSDSYLISNANTVITLFHHARIPCFSATEGPIIENGAYMGLVSKYYMVGMFAGYKAYQILFEGKKAEDIPVERLKKFSFLINIDAAHALDIYPPVPLLRFAEIVHTKAK